MKIKHYCKTFGIENDDEMSLPYKQNIINCINMIERKIMHLNNATSDESLMFFDDTFELTDKQNTSEKVLDH